MKFKNLPMVSHVMFGRDSFYQIEKIILSKRINNFPIIFFLDIFFKKSKLINSIPLHGNDKLIFINTKFEPTTNLVDYIRDELKKEFGQISGIIGIGGGSVMDMTKAVSLMMNNTGSSVDYQGWDLIKNPGVYHACIPTLSGSGSEVSRTAVLTSPIQKLGINSDYTPFNQVILDPNLLKNVPKNQRFYTGMDCYIHCIESLNGKKINNFAKIYGEKSLDLCKKVFLYNKTWTLESDEDLMMASWHGGMSIAYSQVGICHALSYGLSYVLGIKHGIANCIIFNQLEEFYPNSVLEFKKMVEKNEIFIPNNLCSNLDDEKFNTMISISMKMSPLWENALGYQWKNIISKKKIRKIYENI